MEHWIFDKNKKLVAKNVDSAIFLLNDLGECQTDKKIAILKKECFLVLAEQPRLTVSYPPVGFMHFLTLVDAKRKPLAFMQLCINGSPPSNEIKDLLHAEISHFYGEWSEQNFYEWIGVAQH